MSSRSYHTNNIFFFKYGTVSMFRIFVFQKKKKIFKIDETRENIPHRFFFSSLLKISVVVYECVCVCVRINMRKMCCKSGHNFSRGRYLWYIYVSKNEEKKKTIKSVLIKIELNSCYFGVKMRKEAEDGEE